MNVAVISAALASLIAIGVLCANPRRLANKTFASISILGILWLTVVAFQHGSTNPVPWMRINAMLSTFSPWAIALLLNSLIRPTDNWRTLQRRSLPWFVAGLIILPLCFLDSFLGLNLPNGRWSRGWAYAIHSGALAVMHAILLTLSLRELHRLNGIRKIESQILVLNLGIGTLLCLALITMGNLFHNPLLKAIGLLAIFATYAAIAWGITIHKIYDVRQILRSVGHCATVITFLFLLTLLLFRILEDQIPTAVSLFASISITSLLAFWLEPKSRLLFNVSSASKFNRLRSDVIDLSRTEPLTDELILRFEKLLCECSQTTHVAFLFDGGATHADRRVSLSKLLPAHKAICEIGWATPETLHRRRPRAETDDLLSFLQAHTLGLIFTVPRGSPTPSLMLAFSAKPNDWPFTYPEVERLQNIAELMDNILTRSRLIAQAALQARIDHLAMMSRGLAHDLKNLITPVSSFLVHTDTHFPPTSPEGEVHAAARRSVRIMTDYVREALLFSERMEPHFESVNLAQIFTGMRQVTETRAKRRGVTVEIKDDFHAPLTADRVLLQRLLANLVSNAIDASATGQSVLLSADTASPGRLRLQVIDQGTGIPPENVARVFDPYFTTKDLGDDMRGFGLGLTICQKIATLHQGTIALQSSPRRGTRVTVELPAVQSKLRELRPPALDSPLESPAIG